MVQKQMTSKEQYKRHIQTRLKNWIIALRADHDYQIRQNLDRVVEEMQKELQGEI